MRILVAMAAALTATAAFAAGCASIPESTPVEVVGENLGGEPEPTVGAPPAGLDPLSVVRMFVEAGISHTNGHQAARSYLTAEAAKTWDDTTQIRILEDRFDTPPADHNEPDADRRRKVVLRTRQVGSLDQAGEFRPDRRDVSFEITLARENGEWRIADPPGGLLLRISDFRSTFRGVDLPYVDATSNVLVKDRRWVLNRPVSALPGRVVGLLLGEPSSDLTGAVINELRGAKLLTNVAHAPDSVLTVNLTGLQQLNETQRELAAAQIASGIGEVVNEPVRVLVDGERLTPNQALWRREDVKRFEPSVEVSAGLPALVVTGGRVVQIGSDRPMAGIDIPNVVSVGQSTDGSKLAVVTAEPDGHRLWVGTPGDLKPVSLKANTLSKPNWRRGRDEVWVVADGNHVVSVSSGVDAPVWQPVAVPELTRNDHITGLRLSRDGVRVAAIVNNTLVLGSVVGSGTGVSIRNVRTLPPPNLTHMVDVDFFGSDQVVIATASWDTPVYEASIDGLSWRSFGTSNLTPPISNITAAFERPVLVADRYGVWSARTASSVWQPIGHGASAVPVYPG
jgi:Lipoprotein LpqB beta-propeller domain/Sporulation and spore germination